MRSATGLLASIRHSIISCILRLFVLLKPEYIRFSVCEHVAYKTRDVYLARAGEAQLAHAHGTQQPRIDRTMRFRYVNKSNYYYIARGACQVLLLNGQANVHRKLRWVWSDGVISQTEWRKTAQFLLHTWQQEIILVSFL
jgi:hypothetical protein